jgi:energy-coupling factor transporter transmembrane protein EcfT
MVAVHPAIRLTCALGLACATFLSQSVEQLTVLYALVAVGIVFAQCAREHARFVLTVTIPLLVVLIGVWGVLLRDRPPPTQADGIHYALFCWLRVTLSGAILQWLLVPLLKRPAHLRGFLERTGLGGAVGSLIIAAVTFIPEVRRRLSLLIDARRAQGYPTRGIRGLRLLPQLIMPLVASLLYSALHRAEFWSHRGIFDRQMASTAPASYDHRVGAVILVVSLAACLLVVWW